MAQEDCLLLAGTTGRAAPLLGRARQRTDSRSCFQQGVVGQAAILRPAVFGQGLSAACLHFPTWVLDTRWPGV